MNVVIFQNSLPEYRMPLFEAIDNDDEVELTVAYSDLAAVSEIKFSNLKLDLLSFLKFKYQRGAIDLAKNADVLVVMFDIHWISNVALILLNRNKVLLWGHGYGKSKMGNVFRTLLVKLSCGLMVYEDDELDKFISNGVNAEKLFYTGNTVEVKNVGCSVEEKTQFLYVGRLQQRKKIEELLIAFKAAENSLSDDVGITILGDGEIKDDLRNLAIQLKISDRVKFLTGTYNDDYLKSVYSNALAYVSPGHVGLGVLHSFAYGVPVVTQKSSSHAPEVNNIKHGENGLILNNDRALLAGELIRLDQDREFQGMLSKNAYHYYVNNRTMDLMVKRFKNAIKYVCSAAV